MQRTKVSPPLVHEKGGLVDESKVSPPLVHEKGGLVDESRVLLPLVHEKGGLVDESLNKGSKVDLKHRVLHLIRDVQAASAA